MNDSPVGYKNPPKETRWKRGVSGNPRGRPKRRPISLVDIIDSFLNAPMQYREQGRVKTAPPEELLFRKLIEEAMKGSVPAADLILKLRANAHRFGTVGRDVLEIADWLPDYPGQTAEQKTEDVVGKADARPVEWWRITARTTTDNA
jgi:hypothetical protein